MIPNEAPTGRSGMNIKQLPDTPGIYIYRDRKRAIIYVGKAINIKKRVSSYFQKQLLAPRTRQLVENIHTIDTIQTGSEFDALLLEAKLIKKYQPKYNVISRDDKNPLYIKITKGIYPRITTVRREDDKKSRYFGPFPSSRTVRDTLRFLRGIFPFCTEKALRKKPCFYSFISLCDPCPNVVEQLSQEQKNRERKRYQSNIRQILRILSGKSTTVIKDLTKQMNIYAKKEEYRKAQATKQKIDKLTYLTSPRFSPSAYLENPNLYSDLRQQEVETLARLVSIGSAARIEGYDISTIMGKESTGSMVVFENAEPDKDSYRRFKIKTKSTPDDFHMLKEVLSRRLNHDEWPLPDLFLIDGGIGQVSSVLSVFNERGVTTPVVGLAKRLEEIIVPVQQENTITFKTIRIPLGSPALSLLQRIRDESHRFARVYHHLLRKKRMVY